MKNKYYNIRDCVYEYNIQDIPNDKEKNKRYCIVHRNLVVDYVNFRNLLMEYNIVDQNDKKNVEVQECEVKKDEKY